MTDEPARVSQRCACRNIVDLEPRPDARQPLGSRCRTGDGICRAWGGSARGVVRLLNFGADPAPVTDWVSVAPGPGPDLRQIRAGRRRGSSAGTPTWSPSSAAGLPVWLLGCLGDVRLQDFLQRRPVLRAQVDGPRGAVKAEGDLLGVGGAVKVVGHSHCRLPSHTHDDHLSGTYMSIRRAQR